MLIGSRVSHRILSDFVSRLIVEPVKLQITLPTNEYLRNEISTPNK